MHTTRTYIQAVRGKCLLQLSGPADPTGAGAARGYRGPQGHRGCLREPHGTPRAYIQVFRGN